MTVIHPLDWIHQIDTTLLELDENPQFGNSHPLDWKRLEKNLRQLFNKSNLTISHHAKGWMASHHLLDGMSKEVMPLSIVWQHIDTPSFFVTDSATLKRLLVELFETEEGAQYFYETPLLIGFYQYFAVELLRQLEKVRFAAPLVPLLKESVEELEALIGEQSCFVVDVGLTINDKNFFGRVLLPLAFRHEWKTYFAHLLPPPSTDEMKQKIMVELSLEIAHSHFELQEWKEVREGDFVVLDYCCYNPTEHKGSVILTLNQKPVFRGRIKDGKVKITNYPLYEEVNNTMEEKFFDSSFEDDEDDDLYKDLTEESELEEDEDDLFSELGAEKPRSEIKGESKPAAAEMLPEQKSISLSVDELPVHLTVEVGKLRMSAASLMTLAPGNLLDLNVTPEQGVDLVLNGKKVGRGELVRIGDVLGVRILSL